MSIPDFERAEYIAAAPALLPSEIVVHAPDSGAFARAILYGIGGALLGSVIYAIVGIWIQIGFISILVGAMVGNAMMNATDGVGGRRYQVAAVLLTYFAVSFAHLLDVIWLDSRKGDSSGVTHSILLMAFILLFDPLLELAGSVGGGLINLLILFFGMQSAWKVTAGGRPYVHLRKPDPASPLGLR